MRFFWLTCSIPCPVFTYCDFLYQLGCMLTLWPDKLDSKTISQMHFCNRIWSFCTLPFRPLAEVLTLPRGGIEFSILSDASAPCFINDLFMLAILSVLAYISRDEVQAGSGKAVKIHLQQVLKLLLTCQRFRVTHCWLCFMPSLQTKVQTERKASKIFIYDESSKCEMGGRKIVILIFTQISFSKAGLNPILYRLHKQ